MIPPILITFVEGLLGPNFSKLAKPLIYLALIVILVTGFGIAKCSYDRNVIAKHDAQIEQRATPANDKAANERAHDITTNSNNESEMHNVIAAQPDQPISPTSHARACLELHRAGKYPASCGGPQGGH